MFNAEHVVQSGGILAIALMVFAESGLLIGFFLPGDSLLLAAGFFAGQGKLPIVWLIVAVVVAAIIGDNVGYRIGRRFGPKLFKRSDGIFFRREYVEQTQGFYERHGGKTIILARFVPIVRTFAPVVAGVGKMDWRRFTFFNIFGGLFWGVGVTLVGYFIGTAVPDLDNYFVPIVIIGAQVILAIALIHIFKNADSRQRFKAGLRQEWQHFFGPGRKKR